MYYKFDLDQNYLNLIEERFNEKKELAKERNEVLFSIFDESLSVEEEVALKYLYAYMSLNDLGSYDGGFLLRHVKKMLEIRNKMPWGKSVPGQIFLHFVMPIRINNENIEYYCETFFDVLYNRVKDLSMKDAILEVNHWCHEKATYIGCDIRTISPLTLMKNGLGRCGEESSFTTAVLRSLCIPARQCYTPRWAHCDSNHAWVESWADGTWYFLGACEPESKLNMGWFTEPAIRAMLVNTRVPGNYVNSEEVTLVDKWHTEINLLGNYTVTKKIRVKVIDEDGNSVKGAKVHLQVYNKAEFFSIAKLTTNDNGEVSLTTGYGDLLVYAFKDEYLGQEKISGKDETYKEVTIAKQEYKSVVMEIDMVPPPAKNSPVVNVTKEEVNRNNERLKYEDELRIKDQENTFIQREEAVSIAKKLKLDIDRVWDVLDKARGNSYEIASFLKGYSEGYDQMPLKLLESLNDKDLMDTSKDILVDHLMYSIKLKGDYDEDVFVNYIMCPRVYFEMIEPYKQYFQEEFDVELRTSFKNKPECLIRWVKDNIFTKNCTFYAGYASPKGSYELKNTDNFSKDILFVALARSFGIPARLEPTDRRPQFLKKEKWIDVCVSGSLCKREDNLSIGRVKFVKSSNCKVKAEYYNNFSLARLEENGFETLNYKGVEFNYFEDYFEITEGYYRLILGTRLTDGTVLTKLSLFEVKAGRDYEMNFRFREDSMDVEDFGGITDLEGLQLLGEEHNRNIDLSNNTVIAWIEPDREPSKHLLREFKELALEFNSLNPSVYICVGEDKLTSAFDYNKYEGLPQGIQFAVDKNYKCLNSLIKGVGQEVSSKHPVVFVVDTNKIIRYINSGYKLGIGSEIVKVLSSLHSDVVI